MMQLSANLKLALHRNRWKILFALCSALAILIYFLSQSRMPGLEKKAAMGQRTVVHAIAFDTVYDVDPADAWPLRVAQTTVNWWYTNWKGMTFGLLFAAAFLALLSYFPRHSFNNRFLNALKGALTGAPLGVCVNCATPIAHGMYKAGVRTETVLATLVSSPTLNVIVLAMAFSLLPFHLAVAKVAAVLFFVIAVIPLIARLDRRGLDSAAERRIEAELAATFHRHSLVHGEHETGFESLTAPTLVPSLAGFVQDYARALWFVVKTTVPLMLLAGLLGAVLVESIPVGDLSQLGTGLGTALLVALVGTLLPVPMSFDVVTVSLLLGAGVPVLLSTILLFTLGTFSIYPMMILARNVSPRVAAAMFVAVAALGLLTAYGVQAYDARRNAQAVGAFEATVAAASTQGAVTVNEIMIAERTCSEGAPGDQQRCVADFLLSEIADGADASLCEDLAGTASASLQPLCQDRLRQREVTGRAIAASNVAPCAELTDPTAQVACMQEAIRSRIDAGEPLSICNELPSERGVAWCLQMGTQVRLRKLNDSESCSYLKDAAAADDCRGLARASQLAMGRRFEDCSTLEKPREQLQCRSAVAISMVEDGSGAESCAQIGDEALERECRSLAALVEAGRRGDDSVCSGIGPAEESCRRKAMNQRIRMAVALATTGALAADIGSDRGARPSAATASGSQPTGPAARALQPFGAEGGIAIGYFEHGARGPRGHGFTRVEAAEFGLPEHWRFSMLEFRSPFMTGRGIAAGDFDNDHWPDLLLASNDGIHLLRNDGRGGFTPQPLPLLDDLPRDAYVVAFADLNNDGWQDLYVTGYGGRVAIVLNDRQGFRTSGVQRLPNDGAILAISSGFADVDLDGDLDVMLGNWSFGEDKAFLENYSTNRLLINEGATGFKQRELDEVSGDSLSVLFSDLNGDGRTDLVVGNDREIPDMFYVGRRDGSFERSRRADGWIPVTTLNTMSVDSADFDNDLRLDLFSTDMTFANVPKRPYCDAIQVGDARARCELLLEGRERIERRDHAWCRGLEDRRDREECLTAIYRGVAIMTGDVELCERIPDRYAVHREYCRNLARKDERKERYFVAAELPQKQSNVLLMGTEGGGFRDATAASGAASSFWTWNARAADLDNDGWQDIYVGNGFHFGEGEWQIHSNVFFRNMGSGKFEIAQDAFGLADAVNTPSFVSLDYDLDGDLDVIATGVNAPLRVFVNRNSDNNSISFELRDGRGNRFGIGSKVYVYYREAGRDGQQMRELKASGGYLSFEAPVAHFGLGALGQVDRVEIVWSTGERTVLDTPFPANRRYVIERRSEGPTTAAR
jgi:uncharacterized membrane protein YraQ (UPF0718 family)